MLYHCEYSTYCLTLDHKMNALSFETSVTIHATTRFNIPEDFNLEPYSRKNFKSRMCLRVCACVFSNRPFLLTTAGQLIRLRRAVLWLRWLVTSLTVEVRPQSQDSLWWTVCHRDRSFWEYFGFPCHYHSTSDPDPSCHLRCVMSAIYSIFKITHVFITKVHCALCEWYKSYKWSYYERNVCAFAFGSRLTFTASFFRYYPECFKILLAIIDAWNSPLGVFIFIFTAANTTTTVAATTTTTIITLGEKWQGVKLSLPDRGVTSCSNPTEWMSFYDVCVSVIIHRTFIPKPHRGFCTLWSAIHRPRSLLTLLLQLDQTIKWLANYGKFGEPPRSAFEY